MLSNKNKKMLFDVIRKWNVTILMWYYAMYYYNLG